MSNKLNDNEIINAYSYENLVKRFLEYCKIINMDVVKNDGHIFECSIQGFALRFVRLFISSSLLYFILLLDK